METQRACRQFQCWAGSITNTNWKSLQYELSRISYLRRIGGSQIQQDLATLQNALSSGDIAAKKSLAAFQQDVKIAWRQRPASSQRCGGEFEKQFEHERFQDIGNRTYATSQLFGDRFDCGQDGNSHQCDSLRLSDRSLQNSIEIREMLVRCFGCFGDSPLDSADESVASRGHSAHSKLSRSNNRHPHVR